MPTVVTCYIANQAIAHMQLQAQHHISHMYLH